MILEGLGQMRLLAELTVDESLFPLVHNKVAALTAIPHVDACSVGAAIKGT